MVLLAGSDVDNLNVLRGFTQMMGESGMNGGKMVFVLRRS